jgi:hypothetical protein
MAFMKEILRVGVDTLKIDDVNAMKDHMTTLYNAKKSAKAAGKGATAAGGKGTRVRASQHRRAFALI